MSTPDKEKARLEQEIRIHRQVAFASGLFQADVTIRTLLESLAEGVVIIDNFGTILLVNSAAERMFGYQKEDLIGKPHAMLIPERLRKAHEEHEAHYFADPKIRPMGLLLDLSGLRQDGSEFPVEISLGFIDTINGVLVLALVSDITLRKQAEMRLRDSEELFHLQVERVKNYAIFTIDSQGKVLNWNAGAERLTGYRAEEIIGKCSSCFFPDEERRAGRPEEELKKAAVAGQISDEGWRIRKDGSRFWADVIVTALLDQSGSLRGFSKVTHDITGRKKVEDALRFSEARYRALFNDNPTMIFTLDTKWTILSANAFAALQLGYPIDELEGQSMLKLFHQDDRTAVAEQLLESLKNPKKVHRWQFRKIRKDGGLLWVEEIAQPVYDMNGAPNVLVVCQDVTDRKRAEAEIHRLNSDLAERAAELGAVNKELEAFNHTVAHDLRQPLNLLATICQAIKMLCGDRLPEECSGYLQNAHQVTLRMNSLIDALLNFSRMGHVEPLREMVDLSALANEVVAMLKLTEPDRQVDFRIAEGITANADSNMLRVVLENLLGNAWKYTSMREEAVIEVGATEIDGNPVYFVRDNGAGFDKAYADKLFVPFQRLPGAEKNMGFGIGLATVERIVHRHQGRVWAESEPDKGACIYFTLAADAT